MVHIKKYRDNKKEETKVIKVNVIKKEYHPIHPRTQYSKKHIHKKHADIYILKAKNRS